MITNYIKLALRTLARNKLYTIINVLGLSVGFVCAILILLYIDDELSYDKHHEKHERIYRLEAFVTSSNTLLKSPWTPHPLGPTLRDGYPDIADFVRFVPIPIRATYGDKVFNEDGIYAVDERVFDVFTHKFLKGTPQNALQPGTIVLTQLLAAKYFGSEDPLGKTIRTNDGYDISVAAVIEDLPDNSHLKYDALLSMKGLAPIFGVERFHARDSETFWRGGIPMITYVLMHENADIKRVTGNFDWFEKQYYAPVGRLSDSYVELKATALAQTHFRLGLQHDQPTGNILYTYILSTIAVFILLIAAINYMNMATARSAKRAKEIGVRKAMGAHTGQVANQFLVESLAISLLSTIISILSAEAFIPLFNEVSGKDLSLFSSANWEALLLILSVSVLVGLVSGSYPAFRLSRFMPARVLKDGPNAATKSGVFRKILVVVQFALSIVMIIGTLLVSEQLRYLKNKNPGFNRENVMIIPTQNNLDPNSIDAFKTELLRSPLIEKVAKSGGVMGQVTLKQGFMIEEDGELNGVILPNMYIDVDYLDVMGIEIKEGENFARETDGYWFQGFIINEALAEAYGFGEKALGQRMQLVDGAIGGTNIKGEVIGVVKDFNFDSLHNPVEPFLFMYGPWAGYVNVRIQPGRTAEAVHFIKEARRTMNIDSPMEYFFLDEVLDAYYRYEENLDRVFRYFSLICIFISCLGLLGLSSYVAEQRTKEIGIRKVLGSSVPSLVSLLSMDFIKLVAIANLLAWPIAYSGVTKWLERYPYRLDIDLDPFAIAGVVSPLVALLTVGYQAFRAASANPIESLRYE